jgi:hypothetical protein
MKYGDDEIIFFIVREKSIYPIGKIKSIRAMSGFLDPCAHILATTQSYGALCRYPSREYRYMHAYQYKKYKRNCKNLEKIKKSFTIDRMM